MPSLNINNHHLHYADSHPNGAPEQGHTIVFIHGLGSSQNYYFPILPHLTNHRCITIDTYGSARSTYTGQPISIASIAADVIGVLDALSIPKAVAVGHSMGGLVVTLLGAQYADRIKAVVAIGPTHPSSTLTTVMNKRSETVSEGTLHSTTLPTHPTNTILRNITNTPPKAGMEPMANTIPYQATGSGTSALTKSFIRELILGQNPEGYAALCRAIAAAPMIDYSAVQAPFLLIAGEEDKSAPLEGCRVIFDGVASEKKSLEVLQKVGHWHCVEAPEAVGGLIARFVGGLVCRDLEDFN
ncbi:alpha/beta hydrolase [Aspergillus nomiae NRRL 13137]|uniref:Alpha/beta hydrolase n=1 Tax=Aspergillus nomiae NRRL (strain ATCC 15546 / NRRL 13137 / CBS 260.88 / M93) TaxID=1509407 RepID=A0A0L1IQZ5_ASPN3|nr:alpha/beta hydrolase [Aspergillus nomiae NRRL 13137]KNG81917.1 alpha/beta hydrolase [Aspergillus nomiae NRRL 13137]